MQERVTVARHIDGRRPKKTRLDVDPAGTALEHIILPARPDTPAPISVHPFSST
jgi:hypothetical protein